MSSEVNQGELKIIATILAKAEYKAEVVNLLKKVTDETRKEEGNISYVVHTDVTDPLKFVILEHWKSQAAIDFHNQTEHFLLLKSELDKLSDGLTVNILKAFY